MQHERSVDPHRPSAPEREWQARTRAELDQRRRQRERVIASLLAVPAKGAGSTHFGRAA